MFNNFPKYVIVAQKKKKKKNNNKQTKKTKKNNNKQINKPHVLEYYVKFNVFFYFELNRLRIDLAHAAVIRCLWYEAQLYICRAEALPPSSKRNM